MNFSAVHRIGNAVYYARIVGMWQSIARGTPHAAATQPLTYTHNSYMKLHLPKMLLTAVIAAAACFQQVQAEETQAADNANYSVYGGYQYTIVNWQGGHSNAYGLCYGNFYTATYNNDQKTLVAGNVYTQTSSNTNAYKKVLSTDASNQNWNTILLNGSSPVNNAEEGKVYYDIGPVCISGLIVTADSKVNLLWANKDSSRSMTIGKANDGNTGYTTIAKDFTLDLNGNTLTLAGTQVWNITNNATYTIKNTGTFTNNGTLTVNGTLKINKTITNSGTLTVNGTLKINKAITNSGTVDFSNGTLLVDSLNGFDKHWIAGWDANIRETGKTTISFDTEIVKGGTIKNLNEIKLVGQEDSYSVANGIASIQQYDAYGVAANASMDAAFRGAVNEAGTSYLAIKNGATLTYAQSETTFTSPQILVGTGKLNIGNAADFRSTTNSGKNADIQLSKQGLSIDSNLWTGTIILDGAKHGGNNARLNLSLDTLSNANSAVEVKGNTMGYFSGNMLGTLQLTKTKDSSGNEIAAMTINNGSSKNDNENQAHTMGTFSGAVKGDGMLKFSWNGESNANTGYVFSGDISGWKGSFVYDGSSTDARKFNLNLTGAATEVNATISRTGENGKLRLNTSSVGGVTFNKNVKVDVVDAQTGVKLVGNMTTGSFTLGNGATLDFAGGSLTVTNSITLSTVTVSDFSKYFKADNLTTVLVTVKAGDINGWNGALTGSYSVDGKAYTTTINQSGNNIVLSFVADPVEQISLDVTEAVLGESVLALTIAGDLAGMSNVDLLLSAPLLEAIDGKSGLVSLMLTDATGAEYSTVGENPISVTFGGGTYVGEKNEAGEATGMYRVEYIPEPTTATLSLLALCGLAARRRRR